MFSALSSVFGKKNNPPPAPPQQQTKENDEFVMIDKANTQLYPDLSSLTPAPTLLTMQHPEETLPQPSLDDIPFILNPLIAQQDTVTNLWASLRPYLSQNPPRFYEYQYDFSLERSVVEK